ncbi:2'-5'-oligoadenylate synthase 3-like isoform X1 [Dendronephthya gigantea]|uniref:2'-5'-oligoadenylate synthase 3-like isoform X1 n=1 Tax=Dendronephthya gigantea TaxID=151771 RepID=UPI001069BD2B|nr:2'-5'-oligoadenylate synthase 3-like isoform X1 [Dendronephthya gigantea]XP_028407252.1 2'-5'-oligoadenylate synthase 3-like isoform X1 [Dendronephthya gigantea]
MQYTCNVCGELFPNRFSLDRHKKNCTKSKNEDESSPFETLFMGALVVGGIVYTARKVFEAFEKRNQSDTDSASTSGIPGTRCRGMRHPSKREYNPPRLGGIGIRSANACSSHVRSSHATWDIDPFFEDVNESRIRVLGEECDAGLAEALETVPNIDTVDFRSSLKRKDINRYIAKNLQPTDEFNAEMKRAIAKICLFLHQEMRPDKIVKGGSLGKGTAVKGRCDIDLVMVLNEVEDAAELKENLPTIINDVIGKLRQNRAKLAIIPNSLTNARFLVKFSVQGEHGKIDVDLLPTFKVTDLQSLYRKMKTDTHNKEYYSVALAEQQVDFFDDCPTKVKSLIRLVKYWKKKMVPDFSSGRRIPNSYLMELIIIHLWEENTDRDERFKTLKAFHGVMKTLNEYQSLNVIWTENYRITDIPYHVRCTRPLVMDPANPMNNVCEPFVWEEISMAAKEVLESPMMYGVSSESWI